MGLLMVFNTSAADVLDRDLSASTHYALSRQVGYALLAFIAALITYLIGYEALLTLSPLLFLLTLVALLLVFIPGVGQVRNGAHRWVGMGLFSFQPSELAKLTLPLYCIDRLSRTLKRRDYAISGGAVSLGLILVLLEPDNGTTLILGMLLATVLWLMGLPLRRFLAPLGGLAAIGALFASRSAYVMQRIKVYLHPESDLLGKGHQPYQAKIAAGSGGLFGKGVGASLQKLSYLPEAQNDYIAAIFAEEFGFLGILALIFLYALITAIGLFIAERAESRRGFAVAAVMTFLFAIQAFFNLGVVSGLVPTTGLNLPFFSQGGTSLIASSVLMALLFSVDRGRRAARTAHSSPAQAHL